MSKGTFCVYMHTCVAPGDSYGKSYIGQTCRKPENRWNHGKNYSHCKHFYAAIQKYGWDSFLHEVIIDGVSRESADEWERALIEFYQTTNPNHGFNLTAGGRSLVGKENPVSRRVVAFDCITGKRMAEYDSLYEARLAIGGNVWESLNGKTKTCKGLVLKYVDDAVGIDLLPECERTSYHAQPLKMKAINQYRTDGSYVASFDSIKSAALSLGLSPDAVGNAVRGTSKSCGGFQWRFDDGCHDNIERLKTGAEVRYERGSYHGRKVAQIDKDTGEIIRIYPSVREAVRSINGNRRNIKMVLSGVKKTSSGYKWEYVD